MEKGKTGSVDTNIILRLLIGDSAAHVRAAEKLVANSKKLAVSDTALVEAIFVLEKVYELPRTNIVKSIHSITRNPVFTCNATTFETALSLFENESKLSFVDCFLLTEVITKKTTPLYTFDKALIKKSKGICIEPK